MKKSLREELERIHTITYGKRLINEDGFLDRITKTLSSIGDSKKVDNPKKADFVSDDVNEFFKTLEEIDTPITEQKYGSMAYQKSVEAVQIGLMLLGYDLPKHGIDGLFGPETAKATNKFKKDKGLDLINEIEIEAPLELPSGFKGNFGQQRKTHVHNGIDIGASVGTPIKSIADGVVTVSSSNYNSDCGAGIIIKHADGFQSGYCHLSKNSVQVGDTVKQGDVIGLTGGAVGASGSGNSQGPHLHFTLRLGNNPVNPLNYFGSKIGAFNAPTDNLMVGGSSITLEMIDTLIDELKSIGVTSDDLKRLIDLKKKIGTLEGVAATDFNKMNNLIIDKLEGGYYHPKMLKDGRVKDGRYGGSGETMFGMDRKTGEWESRTEEGRRFFKILDDADASSKWVWNYMGGEYESKLRDLSAEMIKREYLNNTKQFLSSESQQIINTNAKLTFNFIYATYNGPGWFQRFAKVINEAVNNGITNSEELNKLFIERRKGSSNSLIAQGGRKIDSMLDSSVV